MYPPRTLGANLVRKTANKNGYLQAEEESRRGDSNPGPHHYE